MKEKSDVGKMVGRRDTIVKVRTETVEVAEERERREVKEGDEGRRCIHHERPVHSPSSSPQTCGVQRSHRLGNTGNAAYSIVCTQIEGVDGDTHWTNTTLG